MPLKYFERDVRRLIETNIPNTYIETSTVDPATLNVIIDGLMFIIRAKPDYPLGCPDVFYIESDDKNVSLNFPDEWHPAGGLVTLVYTIMLDYVPIIKQFDKLEGVNENNSNTSIIESMIS